MAIYLNTYLVSRAYGGPEEGGWWYDQGEPVNSIRVSEEDLDFLQEERDRKLERLHEWYCKLIPCYQAEEPGERKDRISAILDRIQEKQDELWKIGRLPDLRREAKKVNDAFISERPIEVQYKETGGYAFVLSSPNSDENDEDPTPTEYRGDDKYETYIEDHFAEFFPQQRPCYE